MLSTERGGPCQGSSPQRRIWWPSSSSQPPPRPRVAAVVDRAKPDATSQGQPASGLHLHSWRDRAIVATALVATGFAYDNILNVSGMGTLFSIDGELFSFNSGTYFVNLFFNPPDDVSPNNPDAGYS